MDYLTYMPVLQNKHFYLSLHLFVFNIFESWHDNLASFHATKLIVAENYQSVVRTAVFTLGVKLMSRKVLHFCIDMTSFV